MKEERLRQIESLLKTKIDLIIRNELSDQRLRLMSITQIKLGKDADVATVFVSHPADDEIRVKVVEILNTASGFIEKNLARAMRLRKIPSLKFKLDDSMIYAARIDELLDSVRSDVKPSDSNDSLSEPERPDEHDEN